MLYLFDLDGTLISSYMDNPGKQYDNWRVLPGRKERLAELKTAGHSIAVVTNQGGIAFGLVTVEAFIQKAMKALGTLDVPMSGTNGVRVYYCDSHPKGRPEYRLPEGLARRKPSPAMLLEAIRDFPEAATEGVLMVGDREEDQQAAAAAEVRFVWADDFFAAQIDT